MKLEKDKLVAVNVDIYKRKRERKKDKVKKITSQPRSIGMNKKDKIDPLRFNLT